MSYFSPHFADAELRHCRYCRHYGRIVSGGIWCVDGEYVNAGGSGCAYFQREPGSDDDLEILDPVFRQPMPRHEGEQRSR